MTASDLLKYLKQILYKYHVEKEEMQELTIFNQTI